MRFPLGSTSGTFFGPTNSFVITIGAGKKALAQSYVGEEGTFVVSQDQTGSRSRSPVWSPERHGRGRQLALMELISVFPL